MATVLTSSYMMDTTPIIHPALKDIHLLNGDLPRLPLDQHIPSNVLSRRRHAISSGGDSPYSSKPRMKRRGEALAQKEKTGDKSIISSLDFLTIETKERKRNSRVSMYNETHSSRSLKVQEKSPIRECVDVVEQTSTSVAIQSILKANVESWEFDIFAFNGVTEGQPLFHIGLYLFQKHKLIEHFKLDMMQVHNFLMSIESNYHAENAYHNSVHAADVTQAVDCLISDPMIYSSLTPNEIFATILAAMCHDLDHPGVTQSYLINTSSPLAAIHGTNSLLERHHCHTAKAILSESKLLNHLDDSDRQEIISLIEDFILSTDFGKHKHFMEQFEEMLISDNRYLDLTKQTEKHFLLMMAIKAADISNPTRPLQLSKKWSEKIMEEFFLQGDAERGMKLPISFLCDREITTIPKAQSDFFGFVALPLFKAWSQFVRSPLSIQMYSNIIVNKEYWDNIVNSTVSTD